jgi:hypothetical protein
VCAIASLCRCAMNVALLGIDVGYSLRRPTTGIAWIAGEELQIAKTHTERIYRERYLPKNVSFAVIAIDGPLLPRSSHICSKRKCEIWLSQGTFQRRCKPGFSHFGQGLTFRKAATETAVQVGHLGSKFHYVPAKRQVMAGLNIVEAFPNAFIGVLLDEKCFSVQRMPRRRKFDYLYERACEEGIFDKILLHLSWPSTSLISALRSERDHEKRAALVCLITAGCVAAGAAEAVGDIEGGYIWLPEKSLWASWAIKAHSSAGSS